MAYSRQDIAFINNANKIVSDFKKKMEATAKKLDKIDDECAARALERKQPHLCKMETYTISIELWNKKMKERFGLTVEEAVNSLDGGDIFKTMEESETPPTNEESTSSEDKNKQDALNWQEKILG